MRRGYRRAIAIAAGIVVGVPSSTAGAARYENQAYVPFSRDSYWNVPFDGAPVDPRSSDIIAYLRSTNDSDYVTLSGVGPRGEWGNPIYWATASDPTYDVRNTCTSDQPPEFGFVRIPSGAKPDSTSDASMTVYDMGKGLVYGFWQADYDRPSKRWSACGGTVYYLGSNGLAGSLEQSDEPRNYGHRGVPPSTYAVRKNEILAGSIDHVLKVAVDQTRCTHVFPMTGDECGTWAADAPPEGTHIRIDPRIDLTRLGLSSAALTIATALQEYGAVIGDQSGGSVELKMENTVAEGEGWFWRTVLSEDSLSAIELSDFQVIKLGYEGAAAPRHDPRYHEFDQRRWSLDESIVALPTGVLRRE